MNECENNRHVARQKTLLVFLLEEPEDFRGGFRWDAKSLRELESIRMIYHFVFSLKCPFTATYQTAADRLLKKSSFQSLPVMLHRKMYLYLSVYGNLHHSECNM